LEALASETRKSLIFIAIHPSIHWCLRTTQNTIPKFNLKMLAGSTLELSWDHEIRNSLDPAVTIRFLDSKSLFFTPSPSTYSFSVSHKTYSADAPPMTTLTEDESDHSMTTTTKIRGLAALAAYLDLRCESAGHWRLATIVDKEGMIVYQLSWKGGRTTRGRSFMDLGMFGQGERWGRTHSELLEVWRNMI
jgi:hypothetical protein